MLHPVTPATIAAIKDYIKRNNIAKASFAQKAGISYPVFSRLINGKTKFLHSNTYDKIFLTFPIYTNPEGLPTTPEGKSLADVAHYLFGEKMDLATDKEFINLMLSSEFNLSKDEIRKILIWCDTAEGKNISELLFSNPRKAVGCLLALLVKAGGLSVPDPSPQAPGGPDPATK